MIYTYGTPDVPVSRLVAALAERGHAHAPDSGPGTESDATLVLGPVLEPDTMGLDGLLSAWEAAPSARILVVSLLGAHRDARQQRLKSMWDVEEMARATRLPVLTLRLAPLVGPTSPMWAKLARKPRLPRGGRDLIQPVLEEDVLRSLDRALSGHARWEGWYELAGPHVFTLGELRDLAVAAGPRTGRGEWEPPLDEIREHRIAEVEPWASHFGVTPSDIRETAAAWAG